MFPINKYFRKNSNLIITFLLFLIVCLVFIVLGDKLGVSVNLPIYPEHSMTIQDQQEKYIIAQQPISKGSEISLSSIEYYSDPTFEPSPDVITDKTEAVGKMAKVDILPGQAILSHMLIDPFEWAIVSSVAVIDKIAYFWDIDGHLYAVDTETGQEIWDFNTKSLFYSPIVVAEDTVYFFSGRDTYLYALDARTGQEIWRSKVKDFIKSSPTVANGVVHFREKSGEYIVVDAKTGEKILRVDMKSE